MTSRSYKTGETVGGRIEGRELKTKKGDCEFFDDVYVCSWIVSGES